MDAPGHDGGRDDGARPRGEKTVTSSLLGDSLAGLVGREKVLTRPIDLVAYASDASFYRLVPQAVVLAASIYDVCALFRFSRQHHIPLTFRAAGTSLSGQALSDGILVDVARHWRTVKVVDQGRRVLVGPGAIGGFVNQVLRPHRAKIGPDPASINACMMGGILANNSSGMCCGVSQNAYHTLESLTFVLPSGTVIDTADPGADDTFREQEPALASGLLELRQLILSDRILHERIRAKYRMKNTNGYSLNALIDFELPVEMMRHLLVGSEGTLAFIAEAVLNTVPDYPVKYTGLLLFPGIRQACEAIGPLRDAGAAALELMDRAAMGSVEHQPGIPPVIRGLPEAAAGLLVEFQALDEKERANLVSTSNEVVARLALLGPPVFTHDPAEQNALWTIRQGMFPSVGAVRQRGTTVIIEDVVFPIERLADGVIDLTALFHRHGYDEAIIFGHAKDGNLHFVITQSFNDTRSVDRYAAFMDDVVTLVAKKYDGALKGEHGTGRNMAPFVETEWGPGAYRIMRRLKALADPDGLLNPGVIINPDPRAHVSNLKSLPLVEDEVDKCIECGYCEVRCPSRDLTFTPRQRIVVRRELQRLRDAIPGGNARSEALEADFPYDVLDTCAADGLCALSCPVGIDTGQLTKHFRGLLHGAIAHRAANFAARHFNAVERLVRLGLGAGRLAESVLGTSAMTGLTRAARFALRCPTPLWLAPMPAPEYRALPPTRRERAVAVYFPSCVSRTMGYRPTESRSLAEVLVAVAERAGHPVWIPADVPGHCCGVPFASKGYAGAHGAVVGRAIASFWDWSDGGRLPIVVDTSPCTYGLRSCRAQLRPELQERFDRLTILDSIEFVAASVLPKLEIRRRQRLVTLHPVCSVMKLDLTGQLERIARACSEEVFIPLSCGCCGFAGDRGWLFPELTSSATAPEAVEVRAQPADGHYSSSRTCEIAMTRATGRVYRSYLFLLEWASR
jgi:D-lactate dehydrogenase